MRGCRTTGGASLRKPIVRQYLLLVTALVGTLLTLSAGIETYFSFGEKKAQIAELQLAQARLSASRIEGFLQSIENQIRDTNSLPWADASLSRDDLRDEYHRLLKMVPAISELRHIGPDGREVLFVSRTRLDRVDSRLDRRGDAGFVNTRLREAWYDRPYFRDGSEPFVSVAVADAAGANGVTIAEVNLKFVTDAVSELKFGTAGFAFVVDRANFLIAHPNPGLVLRRTDLSAYFPIALLRTAAPAPSGEFLPLRMIEASSFHEGTVLTSAVPVAAADWWVFVEQPYWEALTPVFATLYRSMFSLMLGLLLAVIASYFLARALTGPILRVREGANRISQGDLDARIEIQTEDEIQDLADEFNNMAGKLKESYSGLEQKISDKTMQLELANRHKSEFLANMSHELRTPLNAVIGFSDVLQNQYFGQLNDRQQQYVRDINESGQHLLALINDSLDLSKVEAGRMDLELSRFGLPGAIDNAIVQIRERALRQNLVLTAAIGPGVGEIVADERKLRQILINLLTNAVKFTYPGGQVEVLAARGTSETLVTVRDSGPGIATEDQATIFEEFSQLKTQGSAAQEGTGLGLSLVRRLVELHHGRVWVESEPGHGAAFSFTLPDRELPPTA